MTGSSAGKSFGQFEQRQLTLPAHYSIHAICSEGLLWQQAGMPAAKDDR